MPCRRLVRSDLPASIHRTLELSCEAPLCSASSASTPCWAARRRLPNVIAPCVMAHEWSNRIRDASNLLSSRLQPLDVSISKWPRLLRLDGGHSRTDRATPASVAWCREPQWLAELLQRALALQEPLKQRRELRGRLTRG